MATAETFLNICCDQTVETDETFKDGRQRKRSEGVKEVILLLGLKSRHMQTAKPISSLLLAKKKKNKEPKELNCFCTHQIFYNIY